MSAISGDFTATYGFEYPYQNPYIANFVNSIEEAEFQPSYYYLTSGFSAFYTIFRTPESSRQAIIAQKQKSYFDDFYNRIHVNPESYNAGNVVDDKVFEVELWNAYLEEKDLSSIDQSGDQNVFIDDSSAKTYGATESKIYTITIKSTGDTRIESSFLFNFLLANDVTFEIVGSRVALFPYYFKTGMSESFEWKTDIIESKNGLEQRRKLRTTPRQSLSTEVFLSPNEITRADILAHSWRSQNWALPMWHESRKGTSVTTSDDSISVDTSYGDFRVGSLAVIWSNPRKFDVIEVSAITSSSLTFDRNIAFNFTSPYVVPVRVARMTSDPSRSFTGYNGKMTSSFEVVDNIAFTGADQPYQYNGLDVFVDQPFIPASASYNNPIQLIDYDTGKVEQFSHWDYTKINTKWTIALDNLQAAWAYKMFMHKLCGRAKAFYMPSFESNYRITTTGTVSSSFTCINDGQAEGATARVHIAFLLSDGSWEFAEITDITKNSETQLTVTFTPSLDVDASEIKQCCFMGEKRLASDKVSIKWDGNYVGQTEMAITEYKG